MALEVTGIEKRFGPTAALRDVTFTCVPGEFLALLGPSGSGKTTLLRILAGLDFPDAGSVGFDGEDMTWVAARERRVGLVFQHYALFRHMNVADNVAFGLKVRRRRHRPRRREIAARVAELLARVQLEGLGERYPAQLSGGQRQRVALARALAIEPRLLLLDEPFGALDAKVRKELRRWLRQLHDEMGITTVFVTHDQEEALDLADRVAVLNNGRIEQIGTPSEIYSTPGSAFVCEFLGNTNRLAVEERDGGLWIDNLQLDAGTPGTQLGPHAAYIRPQDIAIAGTDEPGISAIVGGVFTAGPATRLECRRGRTGELVEVILQAGETAPHPGSQVRLRPRQWRLYPIG
jgi:sulfate/thiosulfate transport system ATP-binding protein